MIDGDVKKECRTLRAFFTSPLFCIGNDICNMPTKHSKYQFAVYSFRHYCYCCPAAFICAVKSIFCLAVVKLDFYFWRYSQTLFDKNFSFTLYISNAENSILATLKVKKFLLVPLLLLHSKNDFFQSFYQF